MVLFLDNYLLIPEVTAQIFNPAAELIMPTGIATNEVNKVIEIQLVIVEAKISNCST